MSGKLVIDTNEFLAALARLKPVAPRRRKTTLVGISKRIIEDDFYISFLFGEAVFSSHGVQTRCVVEQADWHGYVSTDFGMILTFLKVKPTGKTVTISFLGNKLKIDSFSITCQWAPVPDWIGSMSTEALFLSEKAKSRDEELFCPKCGKRQIIVLSHKPHLQLELDAPKPPKTLPNRQCKSCKHGWLEIL
ncbi:hypothetical protein ICN46_00065 [Polynucleobacter sp. Latsch14-2]|jgi:hypothetical protein|uniref:hypothetical protein n=1 Tax=Polynucleobacter sp. Latsch14-2 TaxID=2576920 RepID=UPI001C0A9963|nr:hypothetical protein [Polynucleobacter sp. Latsch14-2]MBU3613289.1 hypothetical protein [Polynucleobacter sp. Latsch14-2]